MRSLRLKFENSRFSAVELDLRKIAQMRIRPLDYVRNLTLATRLLLCLWLVFGSLVAFGIHGSSIAETAQFWAPEMSYHGYLVDIPEIFKRGDPEWGNHHMFGERLYVNPGATGDQIATNGKDTSSDVGQLVALQPSSATTTIRRIGVTNSNARSESISVGKPPNLLSGDLLITIVTSSFAYGGLPTPSGWTQIRIVQSAEQIVDLDTYYRVVDGSEPANWTWQLGSPNGNPNARATASIIVYRGVSTSTPIGSTSVQCCTPGKSTSVGSITTLTPNNLVLGIFAEGMSDSIYTPPPELSGVVNVTLGPSAEATDRLAELVMAKSRWFRGDELTVATPYALSQLFHSPRFPVVNTNIGDGQNMLVWWYEFPVLHPATLARPGTWGYFFFGAQRGLAWFWWFQVFACFTALYLLFVIILKGHKGLAAFGAFWFCGSAYVVCWSLWPARITFYIALASVCAYHLLASNKRSVQVVCAVLFGLSAAGFFMMLYPPWQIALGYLFLCVFTGLFIRDRLYVSLRTISRDRLVCIIGALGLAGGLIASFLYTCLPALKLMAGSIYPGKRFSLGGDYSFAMLFKGMYNMLTIYQRPPPFLSNESEASSFYHLFPAVFMGMVLSKRLVLKLGVLGWLLIGYLVAILYFMLVGLPEKLARLSLLGHVPPVRTDLGVGLASITLCIYVLALNADEARKSSTWWQRIMPVVGGALITGFFLYHGAITVKEFDKFPPPIQIVLLASLLAGLASFALLSGRTEMFCGIMGPALVATSALFNPLSTNLSHIYDSELAHEVVKLDKQAANHPLWLCYGSVRPGVLISALGARSLTGMLWPPQLSLWRKFDPYGQYMHVYNNLAHIFLTYDSEQSSVRFVPVELTHPGVATLAMQISPNNPMLKEMGARYVVAFDDWQQRLAPANLHPIYRSTTGKFSIFEIQPPDQSRSNDSGRLLKSMTRFK